VIAVPEFVTDTENDLASIGATVNAARTAAAAPTTRISATADDILRYLSAETAGPQADSSADIAPALLLPGPMAGCCGG
jgi:hypothetical protein